MSDELVLSSHSSTPMYAQIVEQVVAKVMAGQWPAGYLLPSIRELASNSQVSVITVKRAYMELEHAGIIVTQHGKGSFVADRPEASRSMLEAEFRTQLTGLIATARKLGLEPRQVRKRVDEALLQPSDTS
ncbi:GntR family transcriptional regulator [Dyella sp.]|uniref:GntR family transcriptional regulator n=1 Tax=Dyella sp. TaxID=1869338 RepID=UPI002ED2FE07